MKPDIKGLTKLANRLEKVPRKQFDMDHWWVENECGTKGCILGWAAQVFPHRFTKHKAISFSSGKVYEIEHKRTNVCGSHAFAEGFRIDIDQAQDITLAANIATPHQAAKQIRVLIGKLKKAK